MLLRINENKTALFTFLDNDVMFRQPWDREGLAPCSHEVADSGMMVYIADAANKYKFKP